MMIKTAQKNTCSHRFWITHGSNYHKHQPVNPIKFHPDQKKYCQKAYKQYSINITGYAILCVIMKPIQKRFLFRPADIFFILLAIVAIGVSIHTALTQQNGTPYLIISTLEEDWIYPLDRNQKLYIPGAIGESHIEIKNGSAFFIDSPCDNKICVMSQPISRSGEWIACLPNQIFIRIEGKAPQHSLDATSF